MEDEKFKRDKIVKNEVDGKRYYVITFPTGNFAYLTAAYSTNFLGLVNRRKPLIAIQSPIDVPRVELIQTHVLFMGVIESKPRLEWNEWLKIRGLVFGQGKSMQEIMQGFAGWLGVDPETLPEDERERKWAEYKASI